MNEGLPLWLQIVCIGDKITVDDVRKICEDRENNMTPDNRQNYIRELKSIIYGYFNYQCNGKDDERHDMICQYIIDRIKANEKDDEDHLLQFVIDRRNRLLRYPDNRFLPSIMRMKSKI